MAVGQKRLSLENQVGDRNFGPQSEVIKPPKATIREETLKPQNAPSSCRKPSEYDGQ